jgi:hypothetical protein
MNGSEGSAPNNGIDDPNNPEMVPEKTPSKTLQLLHA